MAKAALTATLRNLLFRLRQDTAGDSTDRHLLDLFSADRDEAAFSALVQRHGPMVLGVGRRTLGDQHAAEDVFQATFLVLARRANALDRRRSLGNWLYTVAYRLSLNARLAASRRQKHERQVQAMPLAERSDDASRSEVREVLDAELQRLPEKYRAPLVLCYLQGRTQEQAAQELGWSVGSVPARLERGKELLRERLLGRGLLLSAAMLTTALTEDARAVVPNDLLITTVQGTLATTAGSVVTLSAEVLTLAEGVRKTMLLAKLKLAAAVVLAAGLLGVGATALLPRLWSPLTPTVLAQPLAAEDAGAKPVAEKPVRRDSYGDPLPVGAVARLGTVRFRPAGVVDKLALSADGQLLATLAQGSDDAIGLWDLKTGTEVRQFRGHTKRVLAVALSPDGKTVASGGIDNTIRLWDTVTGKELRTWNAHTDNVTSLAFAADGRTLASGGGDLALRLWDATTGKEIRSFAGHQRGNLCVAIAADGRTLASGSYNDDAIHVWDTASGQAKVRIPVRRFGVRSLALAPDGTTVAAEVQNDRLRLWDTGTGKELGQWGGNGGINIRSVAFAPDGRTAAIGIDGWVPPAIALVDLATAKEQRIVQPHCGWPSALRFTLDGAQLVSVGSGDHTIRIWDVSGGKELRAIGGHRAPVTVARCLPGGQGLLTGSVDGTVRLWDPLTGVERRRILERRGGGSLVLAQDGRTLVFVDEKAIVRWDLNTDREIQRVPLAACTARVVTLSPDGDMLASWDYDKAPQLWDTRTGKELRRCSSTPIGTGGLSWSPDGTRLVAAAEDDQVYLWDAATGKELWRVQRPRPGSFTVLYTLAFSPDGRFLAVAPASVGSTNGLPRNMRPGPIRLYDAATGQEVRQFPTDTSFMARLEFSADSRLLAAAGTDRTIRLWELLSGQERRSFAGHHSAIYALAFAADGRTITSGSEDCTALVWDVTGRAAAGELRPVPLAKPELTTLVNALADADAPRAGDAIWTLVAAAEHSLPLLKQRIKPVAAADAQRLAALIRALDSSSFAERDKAAQELELLGETARPALQQALAEKPTLEVRRRIEQLLERLEKQVITGNQLGSLRAIEVLEHIGTPEARQVLETLATGADGARLTREAKTALQRLAK